MGTWAGEPGVIPVVCLRVYLCLYTIRGHCCRIVCRMYNVLIVLAGMKFAMLEQTIVVALFLATFDEFSICDAQGNPLSGPLSLPPLSLPPVQYTPVRFLKQVYLKCHARE